MIQIPYCFIKDDVINKFENDKQFYNWINVNVSAGRVKRVRNGLYVTVDSMGSLSSNKFEIACKITATSFIAYHSALEFYGLANQVYNTVIVGSKTRFTPFEFDDIEYEDVMVKNYFDVNFIERSNVRVSSLERTIIDCIDNIDLAGGIEELLNALEQIDNLNEKKLLDVLASYNNMFLYQKTGYILEHFKEELKLSDTFFDVCEPKVDNAIRYFLQDEYSNIKFNSKWQLMAPLNLLSRMNGGL